MDNWPLMHGSNKAYLITESTNHRLNQFTEYSGMLLLCSVAEKKLCSSLALPFPGPTILWPRWPQSPFGVLVVGDDIYIVNQMKAELDEERILNHIIFWWL